MGKMKAKNNDLVETRLKWRETADEMVRLEAAMKVMEVRYKMYSRAHDEADAEMERLLSDILPGEGTRSELLAAIDEQINEILESM